jgi:hypothetical protein
MLVVCLQSCLNDTELIFYNRTLHAVTLYIHTVAAKSDATPKKGRCHQFPPSPLSRATQQIFRPDFYIEWLLDIY